MKVAFSKMQGIGNDFVVLNALHQTPDLSAAAIRRLADRHFGIGCDQVLVVERPVQPEQALFRYRIFNADGGEVEQCGNGARCFAVFVREQGLTEASVIPVETRAGRITLQVLPDGQVQVDMGQPRFQPADIPFLADHAADRYVLEVAGEFLEVGVVSMGNPHVVVPVVDVATAPVARLGPLLEQHARFPARVNVGFVEVRSRQDLALRVYERGVGETLACGTGAAAALAVTRRWGWVDACVRVHLPGGTLVLDWAAPEHPVLLTGPAITVFHGQIDQ